MKNPVIPHLEKFLGSNWAQWVHAQREVEDIDLASDQYEPYHHHELEQDLGRRVRMLKPILPYGARILDVGCGAGHFGKVADCFEVIGVDVGVDFEGMAIPADAVTMFHSFEHFRDPVEMLHKSWFELDDGGYLVIETPNRDSFLTMHSTSFREFQQKRNGDRHLTSWSAEGLRRFVQAVMAPHSIEVHQVQRYGLANLLQWLIHRKPAGHLSTLVHSFDDRIDKELERCLGARGLCDTLVAVARK